MIIIQFHIIISYHTILCQTIEYPIFYQRSLTIIFIEYDKGACSHKVSVSSVACDDLCL